MLTAAEWLSENSERQELAVMNIPLAMELYAKYRETELYRPPKDVVEAIESKYPTNWIPEDVVKKWYPNAIISTYSNGQKRVTNNDNILFNGSAKDDETAWVVAAEWCEKQFAFWVQSAALHGYSLASEDKWISVSERLPESNRDVLLYSAYDTTHFFIGYYQHYWHIYMDYNNEHGDITHWIELPSPPKQQQ